MIKDDDFEAIVDMARNTVEEGECPFETLDVPLETVSRVVSLLAPGRDAPEIMWLCTYRGDKEVSRQLLLAVVKTMTPQQCDEFEGTYLEMDDDERAEFIVQPQDLFKILTENGPGLASIARLRRWSSLKEVCMDVNGFWAARIRMDIVKKDWRRAWEDLRRAIIGFPLPNQDDVAGHKKLLQMWSRLRATEDIRHHRLLLCTDRELRNELIHEVFEAMVSNGVVSQIATQEDYLLPSEHTHIKSGCKNARGKTAKVNHKVYVPGLIEATPFMFRSDPWRPIPLNLEGAMIIRMAAKMQEKSSDRRKRKIMKKIDKLGGNKAK